jgi:hypothetical protein
MKIILQLARLESGHVSILVTSREEREITDQFRGVIDHIALEGAGLDADIDRHISMRVYDDKCFSGLDLSLRKEAHDAILSCSRGMYHPRFYRKY